MKQQTMSAEEYRASVAGGRERNKYHAERTTTDGITFDSKAEADGTGN